MKEETITSYLGCPDHPDAGLNISDAVWHDRIHIESATLQCKHCSQAYRIEDEIAYMVPSQISEITKGESVARDKDSTRYASTKDSFETGVEETFLFRGLDIPASSLSCAVDLGAGDGRYTRPLSYLARTTLALDISPKMLSVNRWKAQQDLPHEQVAKLDFVVADAAKLPLKSGIAPFTISAQMIEHLPSDAHLSCLREIRRILTAGGEVRLTAYNQIITVRDLKRGLRHSPTLLKILAGRLPADARSKTKSGYHGAGDLYYYYFTDEELKKALVLSGFQVKRLTGIINLPKRLRGIKLGKLADLSISRHFPIYARSRGHYLAVVAKPQ